MALSLFGCATTAQVAQLNLTLNAVLAALQTLIAQGAKVQDNLAVLTAEVARNTTVMASAKTLISGFAAQLAAAGADPIKLQALQDQLKQNDDSLAAAVAENTSAAQTS